MLIPDACKTVTITRSYGSYVTHFVGWDEHGKQNMDVFLSSSAFKSLIEDCETQGFKITSRHEAFGGGDCVVMALHQK